MFDTTNFLLNISPVILVLILTGAIPKTPNKLLGGLDEFR
jgi:hypothetical protein